MILNTLEETEEANGIFMRQVVVVIHDGSNPAHDLFALLGDEELHLGVAVEGILLLVEKLLTIHQ